MNLAFLLVSPVLTLCQLEIVPLAWQEAMSGAVVMAQGIGTATIALGGGYLITAFGYPSLFLSGALLAALGAGLMWVYSWAPRWMLMRRMRISTI
jgi:predicted MFS family arabinose efflux permease